MTVNIWKSYIWTADKDINMKAIFTVMNTTWAVVKIRPEKKNQPCMGFEPINPWPTELSSQLGAGHYVGPK